MDTKSELELTKNAFRLKEVNRLVVKSVTEGKIEDLYKLLDEFRSLKKLIKLNFMKSPVCKINDKKAYEIITKISNEGTFESDKIIKVLEGFSDEKYNVDELDEEDIDELGSDLFYSWFSHHEYVESLYEIGSLILGISVRSALNEFVSEARSCYAFQQYNAVYSLCRTILEVSLRDICKRKGILRTGKNNVVSFKQYKDKDNISELINRISKGELNKNIRKIYYEKTSFLIHGHKTITSKEAREMFRDTIETVEELYSFNGF